MSHPPYDCENCGITHMSYTTHIEFARKQKQKKLVKGLIVGISVVSFGFVLGYSIIPELMKMSDISDLSDAEKHVVGILIDELERLDGQFVCDYGIFTETVTCLGLQNNVEILEHGYRLKEGTRSGAMFENYEEIAKLKQDHPDGYLHDRNDFTVKEIGTKYYLITQEPYFGNLQSNESVSGVNKP